MSNFKYRDLTASIKYSEEDGMFVGQITDIDSLILFSGSSVDELKSEFRNAVDEYYEHCEQLNVEPQKPYSGTFNVRVGKDIHRQIAAIARLKKISLNETVKKALYRYIDEQAHRNPRSGAMHATSVLLVEQPVQRHAWNEEPTNRTLPIGSQRRAH
jgi:predicted HicB family RNase H-like nuclease